MRNILAVLCSGILLLCLVACTTPQTPAQAVYQVQGNYAAALKVELAYSNLPRCGKPTSPVLCSDVDVIRKVQKVDNVAWIAIKQAQTVVRANEGCKVAACRSNIQTALASAKALTNSFVQITSTLKTP